jgi:hypothetical protein
VEKNADPLRDVDPEADARRIDIRSKVVQAIDLAGGAGKYRGTRSKKKEREERI